MIFELEHEFSRRFSTRLHSIVKTSSKIREKRVFENVQTMIAISLSASRQLIRHVDIHELQNRVISCINGTAHWCASFRTAHTACNATDHVWIIFRLCWSQKDFLRSAKRSLSSVDQTHEYFLF